ncbi:MAG: TatD family hydrolase [Roseibacillus sp.]|jgi:TatD DNase family protein
MLTDSHCHLGSHRFTDAELPGLVARAREAGIHRLVTLATNLADIPTNLAIAERYEGVYACVGIHPCDVQDTPEDYLGPLREFAGHPKTAAIGETGLDYFHPAPEGWSTEDYHQRQREFLKQHFELAAELRLNVVIHTRDRKGDASFADALAIYGPFSERVRAVFHCFPGPFAQAQRVLALGGLVSFTGIATFKKAADVLDAAVQSPAGRFMVETDSPYLAPVPHRGQRCEPAYVRPTAECLAVARAESLESLAKHTEGTVESFFRLGN